MPSNGFPVAVMNYFALRAMEIWGMSHLAGVAQKWCTPLHTYCTPNRLLMVNYGSLIHIFNHFRHRWWSPSFSIIFPIKKHGNYQKEGYHSQVHRTPPPNLWFLRSRWRHINVASPRGLNNIMGYPRGTKWHNLNQPKLTYKSWCCVNITKNARPIVIICHN